MKTMKISEISGASSNLRREVTKRNNGHFSEKILEVIGNLFYFVVSVRKLRLFT